MADEATEVSTADSPTTPQPEGFVFIDSEVDPSADTPSPLSLSGDSIEILEMPEDEQDSVLDDINAILLDEHHLDPLALPSLRVTIPLTAVSPVLPEVPASPSVLSAPQDGGGSLALSAMEESTMTSHTTETTRMETETFTQDSGAEAMKPRKTEPTSTSTSTQTDGEEQGRTVETGTQTDGEAEQDFGEAQAGIGQQGRTTPSNTQSNEAEDPSSWEGGRNHSRPAPYSSRPHLSEVLGWRQTDDGSVFITAPLPGCWACGSANHRMTQCPNRRYSSYIFCQLCGLGGVTVRTCPIHGEWWRARGPYVARVRSNVPRNVRLARPDKAKRGF